MQYSDFQLSLNVDALTLALDEWKCDIYFIVIVVLARDILARLGKVSGSNCAFYEFMIYRNVQ